MTVVFQRGRIDYFWRQRCIYLVMWAHVWPQDLFFLLQKYSNQGILCKYIQIRVFCAEILVRYRYALPSHARLTIWIGPNQTRLHQNAMFILFQVPLINKNGTKSMHCIIRGKFVISPCRKSALFWIRAVILLFRAEILPCGPPLLPHSCAEPFLGVVQKYSFRGDIFTSATWSVYRYSHWPVFSFWRGGCRGVYIS